MSSILVQLVDKVNKLAPKTGFRRVQVAQSRKQSLRDLPLRSHDRWRAALPGKSVKGAGPVN